MYKRTVTYTDYNDQEVTETFYFNLSKKDMTELLKTDPDIADRLNANMKAGNGALVFSDISKLILLSYGIKGEDGKSFAKKINGVPLSETFGETAAYEQIFSDLVDNLDESAAFLLGIFPQDIAIKAKAQAEAEMAAQNPEVVELPAEAVVVDGTGFELPAPPNFESMTPEEFEAWKATH